MGPAASIRASLLATGFAAVAGEDTQPLISSFDAEEWAAFAASWDDLALDSYLLEQGLRRRRRHAMFAVTETGEVSREPHQPHYQSRKYNALQGGIERWFEPIRGDIADGRLLRELFRLCGDVFTLVTRGWRAEVHQFRLEAWHDQPGRPTPEGMHRDGVDFVLVLLVARTNIASGTTQIESSNGQLLDSFTLTNPLDAVFVDDTRVAHGVTPIHAMDETKPAYRDVLVMTFKRE